MALFSKQIEEKLEVNEPNAVENNLDSSQVTAPTSVEAGIETEPVITPEMQAIIDKLAEEKANAVIAEALPKAKKSKEEELEIKIQEAEKLVNDLANKFQEQEVESQLSEVADEFKDYLKFKVKTENLNVNEFLTQNPHYKRKVVPTQEVNNSKVGQSDIDRLLKLQQTIR